MILHPRTYQQLKHLGALYVEVGERAFREMFDWGTVAAARMARYTMREFR